MNNVVIKHLTEFRQVDAKLEKFGGWTNGDGRKRDRTDWRDFVVKRHEHRSFIPIEPDVFSHNVAENGRYH